MGTKMLYIVVKMMTKIAFSIYYMPDIVEELYLC